MQISYILLYLCVLSLVSFALMGVDKWRARRGRYRISERTLFLFAAIGGAAGATLGMHVFRHKTRHWYFRWGFPALLLLHVAFLVLYVWRGGGLAA